jgi:5-methylthioribose kinase
MSDFYDLTSPLNRETREDKSDIDLEQDIPLCDISENVILKPLNEQENNTKLICPQYSEIYKPHYEIIKT